MPRKKADPAPEPTTPKPRARRTTKAVAPVAKPKRTRAPRPDGQLVAVDVGEEDRAYEAHKLRLTGMDWRTVASQVGYTSAVSAQVSVRAYLQRAAATRSRLQQTESLDLAIERLDELLAKAWAKVEDGDLKAIDTCQRLIMNRARLEGHGVATADKDSEGVTYQTVVVAPENFAEIMRAVAEGRMQDVPALEAR